MYISINTVKVHVSKEEAFVEILDADTMREAFKHATGFRGVYLLQLKDEPQEFVSLSMWDSPEDGVAFFTSQEYFAVVGGVRDMLATDLVRKGYVVCAETLP